VSYFFFLSPFLTLQLKTYNWEVGSEEPSIEFCGTLELESTVRPEGLFAVPKILIFFAGLLMATEPLNEVKLIAPEVKIMVSKSFVSSTLYFLQDEHVNNLFAVLTDTARKSQFLKVSLLTLPLSLPLPTTYPSLPLPLSLLSLLSLLSFLSLYLFSVM
jgi:hypothetical protein